MFTPEIEAFLTEWAASEMTRIKKDSDDATDRQRLQDIERKRHEAIDAIKQQKDLEVQQAILELDNKLAVDIPTQEVQG